MGARRHGKSHERPIPLGQRFHREQTLGAAPARGAVDRQVSGAGVPQGAVQFVVAVEVGGAVAEHETRARATRANDRHAGGEDLQQRNAEGFPFGRAGEHDVEGRKKRSGVGAEPGEQNAGAGAAFESAAQLAVADEDEPRTRIALPVTLKGPERLPRLLLGMQATDDADREVVTGQAQFAARIGARPEISVQFLGVDGVREDERGPHAGSGQIVRHRVRNARESTPAVAEQPASPTSPGTREESKLVRDGHMRRRPGQSPGEPHPRPIGPIAMRDDQGRSIIAQRARDAVDGGKGDRTITLRRIHMAPRLEEDRPHPVPATLERPRMAAAYVPERWMVVRT